MGKLSQREDGFESASFRIATKMTKEKNCSKRSEEDRSPSGKFSTTRKSNQYVTVQQNGDMHFKHFNRIVGQT